MDTSRTLKTTETFFIFFVSRVLLFFIFASMKEKLDHILLQARSIFMRYGLKSVTMDDVCREMGISKKTLYQFVCDKQDLVKRTVEREVSENHAIVEGIVAQKLNAIDELVEITVKMAERLKHLNPSVAFDMQKYYPESWAVMVEYRSNFMVQAIYENTLRGQEQELFLKDFDPRIVARFYTLKLEFLADADFAANQKISAATIFFENLKYHIRGIGAPKGLHLLEEKLKHIQP